MILALEEAKYRLENFRADIKELGSALRIDDLRQKVKDLEATTSDAAFWNDQETSGKTLREIKRLKDKIQKFEALSAKLEDTITLAELAIEENDESLIEEVETAEKEIRKDEETQRIEILLSGEYDQNNAILSFHPGAGGTEAQDWAQMLYRMYTRWGERHGYNVKLIDWLDGEEAGLKAATIMIEGENAYGYLKSENGVHRLVRVSPFDASGRRHTSFASVEVMPEFTDDGSIEINEADLEITTHKSSGAGGQH
ncbi:MAG: PCRF domain-containing protein, partial [Clostridia bacterium]|nr:PCRF domain-containing protein [Clostridia bacterium]